MKATIIDPIVDMHDDNQPLSTQLLYGEEVTVHDTDSDLNYVWVTAAYDGYQGFIQKKSLAFETYNANHMVISQGAFVHSNPSVKTRPHFELPFGASIVVKDPDAVDNGFVYAENLGWVFKKNIMRLDDTLHDYIQTAKRFLNTNYLYGGKSQRGIDCSALVQMSLKAAGISVVRDSGPQSKTIGESIMIEGTIPSLQKGDFVFFPGHVGMMVNADDMIHANATSMCVSVDNLNDFVSKVKDLKITNVRRIPNLTL